MSPETFVYWLQGFVELTETDSISDKQWLVIKDHLKLVFDKKTPDRNTIPYTPTPTLKDLIGVKDVNWNERFKPPYEITCKAGPSLSLIC